MTIPMLVLWSLTLAGLCTSIFALSVALRSSARSLSKRLYELSERASTTDESIEKLSHELRNLRSRLNMQNHRARKRENGETPVDDAAPRGRDWVRKANLALALGNRVPTPETERD